MESSRIYKSLRILMLLKHYELIEVDNRQSNTCPLAHMNHQTAAFFDKSFLMKMNQSN